MRRIIILLFVVTISFAMKPSGCSAVLPNLIYVYKYGPAMFSQGDIGGSPLDLIEFARRLKEKQWPGHQPDSVSSFVNEQLDKQARDALNKYETLIQNLELPYSDVYYRAANTIANTTDIEAFLITNLNRIIRGPCIYENERFQDVELSPQTKKLLKQKPQGDDLIRVNWLLLKDAYPQFARGTVEADGRIRGLFKRKDQILHIQMFPNKLSQAERQDIWVALSPTNRIALADITEDKIKLYSVDHCSFEFYGKKLARFSADIYGYDNDDPDFKMGNPVSVGSIKNKSSLRLPCSVEDFEKVFGNADEIKRIHRW
jgi:hypothetical protein